jgi:hypothetical protein
MDGVLKAGDMTLFGKMPGIGHTLSCGGSGVERSRSNVLEGVAYELAKQRWIGWLR